jgi:hypothetical protein
MIDGVAARRSLCDARLSAALAEGAGEQLRATDQRADVHAHLFGMLYQRIVAPDARRRRPADTGRMHGGIERIEVGEDADLRVRLRNRVDRIGERAQPAVEPAQLGGQRLALGRRARHGAGAAAQIGHAVAGQEGHGDDREDGQHAELEPAARHFHDPRRLGAVGNEHDGPAALGHWDSARERGSTAIDCGATSDGPWRPPYGQEKDRG